MRIRLWLTNRTQLFLIQSHFNTDVSIILTKLLRNTNAKKSKRFAVTFSYKTGWKIQTNIVTKACFSGTLTSTNMVANDEIAARIRLWPAQVHTVCACQFRP